MVVMNYKYPHPLPTSRQLELGRLVCTSDSVSFAVDLVTNVLTNTNDAFNIRVVLYKQTIATLTKHLSVTSHA